ncbi:MAG: hypothetical protein ACOYEG_11820 [Petrimonas sp.]
MKRLKKFKKRFETLTPDLTELRDVLVVYGCGSAAMENRSICWMPVWRTLESDV